MQNSTNNGVQTNGINTNNAHEGEPQQLRLTKAQRKQRAYDAIQGFAAANGFDVNDLEQLLHDRVALSAGAYANRDVTWADVKRWTAQAAIMGIAVSVVGGLVWGIVAGSKYIIGRLSAGT